MASGSPTSNFMPLQPCNAKSDLSASRYSSWWAMRRGASLRTRSGANPAFRSDRPPRKCFFSLTRITSPARPVTTYKERAQLAMRRAGGARSHRRCHTLWQTPVSPKAIPAGLAGDRAPAGNIWSEPNRIPMRIIPSPRNKTRPLGIHDDIPRHTLHILPTPHGPVMKPLLPELAAQQASG